MVGCGGSSSSSGGGNSGGGGGSTTPTTVTFTFTGQTPTAVAAKVGTGSFTSVTPASSVSLSVPSGTTKFAVAYVCPAVTVSSNQITYQTVVEATISDGTAYTYSCKVADHAGTTGSLTMSVDASAIADATEVSIEAKNSQYYTQAPYYLVTSDLDFAAPVGIDRVDIVAWNNAQTGGVYTLTAVAAKSFTGQSVPGTLNGGDTVVLGSEDLVSQQSITYSNVASGYTAPDSVVDFMPTGNSASLFLASNATSQYPVLPAGVTLGGGTYEFLSTTYASNSNPSGHLSVLQKVSSAKAITVDFPDPWSYAGPTAAVWPTMTFAYSGFSGKSGVSQTGEIDWLTGGQTQSTYTVISSYNYQGGSTQMAFPNLSGLSGFLAAPGSGTTVVWGAVVTQSDVGILKSSTAGESARMVTTNGFYTVP